MEKETTQVRNQHKNTVFIYKIDINLPDLQWPQRTIVGKSNPRHIHQQSGRRLVTKIIDFKTRNFRSNVNITTFISK